MIKDNKRLVEYFEVKNVNSVFKILPLYEENNANLDSYISSLIIELDGLESYINYKLSEFVTLIAVISSLQNETKKTANQDIVKREVFKAIEISKSLASKMVD
ncbi:hypothetical protein T548_0176 [Lactococcus phage phiL47]|uniref:Uncharacterized protein n=1 Tax=Lactococcus phage phiL47 TaxID=1412875 RepID=V9VF18_9CAUD|nr:hypothetical protein T548_0176 [Lactococcus phage phiL47]AHC94253.1 hypothetical protein T548_0176 [Lactococcus phage phiL47]